MPEDNTPSWTKIDDLFSKIDGLLDDAFTKDEMNFLEVQIVLLLINEKISEEKYKIYSTFLDNEQKGKKDPDIYR